MTSSPISKYTVEGMTCGHCRDAVLQRVRELSGVEGAEVDLDSGRLEVRAINVDDAAIESAVRDAGYRVAGKP